MAYCWLAFGTFLIVVELLTAPGLGLFIGGLGAYSTAIIITTGVVDKSDSALQFVAFFGFTAIWAAILWKYLKKFRHKLKAGTNYSDVIGGTAIIAGNGLKRGETGQISWSGTLVNAEIDDAVTIDFLPTGTHVEIKSVSGNTFKVTPK